jgi:preprotein translocase SecE subunit
VSKSPVKRFTRFFSGIWGEMKKVVWLSKREAAYLTVLVIIGTIAAGIILYAFDFGFSTFIDKLILNR